VLFVSSLVGLACSVSLPGRQSSNPPVLAGSPGLDKPRNHDRFHHFLLVPERTRRRSLLRLSDGLPKQARTWL